MGPKVQFGLFWFRSSAHITFPTMYSRLLDLPKLKKILLSSGLKMDSLAGANISLHALRDSPTVSYVKLVFSDSGLPLSLDLENIVLVSGNPKKLLLDYSIS